MKSLTISSATPTVRQEHGRSAAYRILGRVSSRVPKDIAVPVIGWREWASLPELGVVAIKVKVDTGARTSALHAYDLQLFRRRGERWVRFVIHPLQRDVRRTILAEAPVVDERLVRSSSGAAELRPVICTPLELGGSIWPVEITLTNRDAMGFRMLLGRNALRKRYVVDPSRSYLVGVPPRRRRKPSGAVAE